MRTHTALLVVLAGCSHFEPLSNAYSPFSRNLGVAPSAMAQRAALPVSSVPLSDLVSDPRRYHGCHVRTEGYVTLEFEGNTLCPVPDPVDWEACVWLDIDGLSDPGFRRGRAVVDGTFNGENLGHLGLVSGAIEYISSLTRPPS